MPVSHLGLTVSHIPSATSFYLAALQPLGYRYIGHQGNSIGLGIDSADFFLTQSPIGTRPSPNHIAFLAESRLVVRECYASALNSGALPSGAPNYRNADCSCFNAAVEDLDGNTVEFIFRQPHGEGACCETAAPSQGSRVLTWQNDVAGSAAGPDDARSLAPTMVSQGSLASKTSRKSRMQTALDLASTTSKPAKSEAPTQGISRSSTAPAKSDFPGKALLGTALGAAAGAALLYAMTKAESANAKEEADHLAYMASKPRSHARSRSRSRASADEPRPPPPRAETVPPSVNGFAQMPPQTVFSQAPRSERETRRFHRNFSTTESVFSRPPRAPTNAMRMIEATGHNDQDDDVQEFMRSHNNLRPQPTRSRTYDEQDCVSAMPPPSTHSTIKRASTLPVEDANRPDDHHHHLELPPPKPKSSVSRHSGTRAPEAPRSYHAPPPPPPPPSSASASSRHRRSSRDDHHHPDGDLKRHDSGISMHSHRSRRDRDRGSDTGGGRRSSAASTLKPASHRRDSAIAAAAAAAAAAADPKASRAPSSCYFPAAISLPPSAGGGGEDDDDRESKITAFRDQHHVPPPPPVLDPVASKQSWEDFVPEGEEDESHDDDDDDDGLGDVKTVLPEDSISCVDLGKQQQQRRRRHRSRREQRDDGDKRGSRASGGRRSDVTTVRPIAKEEKEKEGKGSVFSIARRNGKRSLLGF